MTTETLTNKQLYYIKKNKRLDTEIRSAANRELNNRKIDQIEYQLIVETDNNNSEHENESLSLPYKLVALLIPYFWVVHVLITSKYLAYGKTKKWRQSWIFFCLGLFIWTVGIILFAKLSILHKK